MEIKSEIVNATKEPSQARFELTQDEGLRQKVRMAAIKAANAVLSAPERSEEYPFCYLIIREPMNAYWLDQMLFSVVSNPLIVSESPDDEVEFQVNSIFQRHAQANKNL